MTSVKSKKKLIEVALPLEAINIASAREKSIRHGHPSTLHLWWARRPLAAARAVIFAQMVDDPSSLPDLFPTEKKQEKERQRLFKIIKDLVKWENTNNEEVLNKARNEIWQSWRRACAENVDHPQAKELFNRTKLPSFHDPFAGGGALPLEAQRLGMESFASDLNPVAVLINKSMIEIPSKFQGRFPVNPNVIRNMDLFQKKWTGAHGIAEDVRYYGKWLRDEAERRIGSLYPKVEVTKEMTKERSDLEPFVGKKLTVIAWLWARTVKSPDPAFNNVHVPLVSTFILSSKPDKVVFIEPVVKGDSYSFSIKIGKPIEALPAKNGTKLARGANFRCLVSNSPISGDYLKEEGKSGRMQSRLMAIVVDSDKGRIFLPPSDEHEYSAHQPEPKWKPDQELEGKSAVQLPLYGMKEYWQLYTPRQLVALVTFSDLVQEMLERIKLDAINSGLADDNKSLRDDGISAMAYAETIAIYLGFGVDKMADRHSTLGRWDPTPTASGIINTFSRQALPMTWDYAEGNPFSEASGNFDGGIGWIAKVIDFSISAFTPGMSIQSDAATQNLSMNKVVSTDPPYYDNIGYADLSDYFYVWLRHSLRNVYPTLFSTMTVPKTEELVATASRHGGKEKAENFFLKGMTQAMHRIAEQAHFAFPVTIYYAFKQSETESEEGTSSTGWQTFLEAVINSGFSITGTWPMRTELSNRMIGSGTNALASSIILVCRQRDLDASSVTRREFVNALKTELPEALAHLQRGNIAPVDLAQAAIGPGMAVYTRYIKVLDAEGKPLLVREALTLINQILDEALAEQEGDFDNDSRWALTWFEQSGFAEGEYGTAEQLSKSKNTSVSGMVEAGILESKRGKVHLLRPEELKENWDPSSDNRVTHWETVHHLIRALDNGGESAAAKLVSKLGTKAETARELCYRLYTICERKKRTTEALAYNGLVQSWPEIVRLSGEEHRNSTEQASLFNE